MKREGGDPFLALMKLIAEKQKDSAQRFYSICDVLSHICFKDEFDEELKALMWDCLYCGEHFTTKEQNRIHVP